MNINKELINEITNEMDKYTNEVDGNYVLNLPRTMPDGELYPVRCLGATRGHISINRKGVIDDIKIYNDSRHIYDKGIDECVKKYIGIKIIL